MNKSRIYTIISIILWLMIWFIGAHFINNELFLPKPLNVLNTLIAMAGTSAFYKSILFTLKGITLGFLIGFGLGILLAVISYLNAFAKSFISILIKGIKSIPIASFVILALFLLSASHLSILISALIVLPVIYTNVLTGLNDTPTDMLEFAKVFHLKPLYKVLYIYIPSIMSPLISACAVSVGYAWKSGVAAEIIGLITGSVGNELYKSKLYLDTPQLFAWTITIIAISFICEKFISLLLQGLQRILGGNSHGNSDK